VKELEREVESLKKRNNIKNDIFFMPIIESAMGVIKSYEIASASKNNCALAIGLEDYTADIGTQRTEEGKESFVARSMVVNAARAAGIQAIDTVFSDVADMEGLRQSVLEAKSLGFEGKGCIHPRQIKVVHEAFAPTTEEIKKAKKIVLAFEEAKKKGLGVVSVGSKMIDPPVVKRAMKIIELAKLSGQTELVSASKK
jgi:citrate lyase subunit beta/citryl-CoA lyase